MSLAILESKIIALLLSRVFSKNLYISPIIVTNTNTKVAILEKKSKYNVKFPKPFKLGLAKILYSIPLLAKLNVLSKTEAQIVIMVK